MPASIEQPTLPLQINIQNTDQEDGPSQSDKSTQWSNISQNSLQINNLIKQKCSNPTPIGLLAFGMTTITLVFAELEWEHDDFVQKAKGYGLWYGGLVLFLSGWCELLVGHTFTATCFVTYGTARLVWFLTQHEALEAVLEHSETAFGTMMLNMLFGGFTGVMCLIAVFKKPIVTKIIFFSLTVMFFMYAGGVYHPTVQLFAGVARFVSAVVACYAALAMVVRDEMEIKLPGL